MDRRSKTELMLWRSVAIVTTVAAVVAVTRTPSDPPPRRVIRLESANRRHAAVLTPLGFSFEKDGKNVASFVVDPETGVPSLSGPGAAPKTEEL